MDTDCNVYVVMRLVVSNNSCSSSSRIVVAAVLPSCRVTVRPLEGCVRVGGGGLAGDRVTVEADRPGLVERVGVSELGQCLLQRLHSAADVVDDGIELVGVIDAAGGLGEQPQRGACGLCLLDGIRGHERFLFHDRLCASGVLDSGPVAGVQTFPHRGRAAAMNACACCPTRRRVSHEAWTVACSIAATAASRSATVGADTESRPV